MSALADIETPALLLDADVLDANVARMAELAARHDVRLLPHAKSHKSPDIARAQLAAGAAGLTCQTIGEAEAMLAADPPELLIPFELVGAPKLRRAAALARQVKLATVVDSLEGAVALDAAAAAAGATIDVLLEIECDYRRCGIAPERAVQLAVQVVARCPHLRLEGILTYEGHIYDRPEPDVVAAAARETYDMMGAVAATLRAAGNPVSRVSVGASAAAELAATHPAVTELRCGSYSVYDLTQVAMAGGGLERCALQVLAMVISIPARDRIVLDSGSKALSFAELPGFPGHGVILGHPEAVISRLSDEHAMVDVPDASAFHIGQQLRIAPNQHALCVGQFDELNALRGGEPVARWPIARRRVPAAAPVPHPSASERTLA